MARARGKKKRDTKRKKEKISKLDRQLASLEVQIFGVSWFWCNTLMQKKPNGICGGRCNKRCKDRKIMSEFWKRHYQEMAKQCPGMLLPMVVEEGEKGVGVAYNRVKTKAEAKEEKSDARKEEDKEKEEAPKENSAPIHIFLKAQNK